jgi:hypothetical protein
VVISPESLQLPFVRELFSVIVIGWYLVLLYWYIFISWLAFVDI